MFDNGGPNIAYVDNTAGNAGHKYRDSATEGTSVDVDIEQCSDLGGGYDVYQTQPGEYLVYSITVPLAGNYSISARVLSTVADSISYAIDALSPVAGPSYNTGGQWTTVTIGTTSLSAGNHKLKILFGGASLSTKYNYLTVSPALPAVSVPSTGPSVNYLQPPYFVSGDTNIAQAKSNATALQSAIASLPAGGGTITLPAGTYYLCQAFPTDAETAGTPKYAWDNAAVTITKSNVRITSANPLNPTTLAASYRTTTLLYYGDSINIADKSNFIIDNVRFTGCNSRYVGTPSVTNGLIYQLNYLCRGTDPLGSLVVFSGQNKNTSSQHSVIQNVAINACSFINSPTRGIYLGYVRNANIARNAFNFFANGEGTSYGGHVGILGNSLFVENAILTSNSFNGNSGLSGPDQYAADGLVWFAAGGNFLINSNSIVNNGLEGIQLNAGPYSIVENTINSAVSGVVGPTAISCGQLGSSTVGFVGPVGIMTFRNALAGTSKIGPAGDNIYAGYSIVNNRIDGCRCGIIAWPSGTAITAPYDIWISGNKINPYIDFNATVTGAHAVQAINLGAFEYANLSGNTVGPCVRSVVVGTQVGENYVVPGHLLARCNDFSNSRQWALWVAEWAQECSVVDITMVACKISRGSSFGYPYHMYWSDISSTYCAGHIASTNKGVSCYFLNETYLTSPTSNPSFSKSGPEAWQHYEIVPARIDYSNSLMGDTGIAAQY